jgi:fluoride exporter
MLRFAVDRSISSSSTFDFPLGTLVVNLSGAFLLGLVSTSRLGATPTLLFGAATLGSYTTFSTWMFESHRLGEDGRTALMATNLGVSLLLGLAACALGRYVGTLL